MNFTAIFTTGTTAGAAFIILACAFGPIPACVFFSVFVGLLIKYSLAKV